MTKQLSTEITPEVQEKITNAVQAYETATSLAVTDQETYESAGDYINELKQYKKNLEKERKDITGPLDEAKKKIMAKFKPHIDAIDRAINQINKKMIGYYREQEKKRLEEEAKAAEKARKEQEKLQKRIEAATEKGQVEKAAAIEEQKSMVDVAPISEPTAKQTGSTTIVTTWSATVYDKLSLIKAVASGEASMELLEPNMPALNKLAQANKELLKLPGVRSKKTETVRSK